MDLVIFGAQAIALGAYNAINSLYPRRKIICFLVTKSGNNAKVLSGLPVRELAEFASAHTHLEKQNMEVLIAVPENVMGEIEQSLDSVGLTCHVRLNSARWAQLMGSYFAHDDTYRPLASLPVGYHRANLHVFMVKFFKDQALSGDYKVPKWISPVQAGAVCCNEQVATLLDNEGENISAKNGNYSELTVLYWMWKNRLKTSDGENVYYGLVHYRRILGLSEDDILKLSDNEVDVVLPYPMPYEPNIHAHHERYLKESDWNAMLTALKELQPEYAAYFPEVLEQKYLYNYNIILARKSVLRDYCRWLFPILERTEELSEPKGCDRADRYIGYMGETLETLYFMKNKDKLNIVHTECKLYT